MLSMISQLVLASRYLLVIFFLGLIIGLALYALRFAMKVWDLAAGLFDQDESQMLIEVLHLIDAVLVASLVVMVALSSFDSLVNRLQGEADEAEMRWVSRTDHSNLKLKVATAMVAISSIHLLQVFLRLEDYSETGVMWRVVIHVVFVAAAVLLGVLDRIGRHGDAGKNEQV